MTSFEQALQDLPLIAILRHLDTASAPDIGSALYEQGFRLIEVPLNDEPTALRCIELLVETVGTEAIIGAGTVTSPEQVRRVHNAGAKLIVSPNIDVEVVAATLEAGLTSCPGVSTPTEAFTAIGAGADLVKLFPASMHGTAGLRALLDVLPPSARLVPVGGVSSENAADWRRAGAAGLGIGSALYKQGSTASEVTERARAFVTGWNSVSS